MKSCKSCAICGRPDDPNVPQFGPKPHRITSGIKLRPAEMLADGGYTEFGAVDVCDECVVNVLYLNMTDDHVRRWRAQ